MSARMETEPVSWETAESIHQELTERTLSEIASAQLSHHAEKSDAIMSARLREKPQTEPTPLLKEQSDAWFAKRDQMRSEIRRGRECLEQVKGELAALRARLDDWPGYELVCGKNPMLDYMQAIAAKERIEQFLPGWLKDREEQLRALDLKIERHARQEPVACSV